MKLIVKTLLTFLMLCARYIHCKRYVHSAAASRFNALKFGNTIQDYILHRPDMTPLRNKFSVCSWVRKLRRSTSANTPVWISYAVNGTSRYDGTGRYDDAEITVTDDGFYSAVLGFGSMGLESGPYELFNRTFGTWYHYCVTWSMSTTTQSIYFNGNLIGDRDDIPENSYLRPGGYLMLGNDQDYYGGGVEEGNIFGGELYKLNIFSKELSREEVKEMADNKCGIVEESYGEVRHIRWENILSWERNSANVTEISSGCTWETLNPAEKKSLFNDICEDLEQTRKESEDLKMKLSSKTVQVTDLQSGIEEKGAQLTNMTAENEDLKADLKEKGTQFLSIYTENGNLKEELEKVGVQLNVKIGENEDLKARIEEKIEEMIDENADLLEEKEEMKTQNDNSLEKKNELLIVTTTLAGVFLLTTIFLFFWRTRNRGGRAGNPSSLTHSEDAT